MFLILFYLNPFRYVPATIHYQKSTAYLKIHKPNTPSRIIVSSIGTAFHPIAIYLHNIISDSIPKGMSHINNSFEFYNTYGYKNTKLRYLNTVTSLFTNVSLNLVLDRLND